MPELLHLPFSPWSEKAAFALDLRGISYRKRHYQPLIGEPALRRLLSRWRGPVTVPVLIDGKTVLGDSFAIAKYADAHGSGPKLFPDGCDERIAAYNVLSETALDAGRALSLPRVLESRAALLELLPKGLRGRLGALGPVVAKFGVKRTLRKYGGDKAAQEIHRKVFTHALDQLRADLGKSSSHGEPKTLLADFSYADVVMAQILTFVDPPKVGLRIGAHNRQAFHDADFASRYADLVSWRDAVYERYRIATAPIASSEAS